MCTHDQRAVLLTHPTEVRHGASHNDLWSQLLPKSAKEGITDSLREGPGMTQCSCGTGEENARPSTRCSWGTGEENARPSTRCSWGAGEENARPSTRCSRGAGEENARPSTRCSRGTGRRMRGPRPGAPEGPGGCAALDWLIQVLIGDRRWSRG